MDIAAGEICIGHSLAGRLHRTLYEISRQFIEFRTRQREVQMFRARSVSRDERQVDIRLRHARELDLGFLSCFFQALGSHLVLGQIDAVLFLELVNHPVHDLLVEIITAKMRITIGSQNFERAARELQNRYIERTTTKVEYEDRLVIIFVEAISESCSRRLVDDAQYFEAGNLTGILGCLTLAVVEVSRNRDDSLADRLTQISFRIRFQFLQDHSRDFLRRVILAIDTYFIVRLAHVTFDGRNRAVRIGYRLTLSQLTDQTLAVFRETNNGRRDTAAFRVRDNSRLAAFHNGYYRVRSTQIDTDYF